MNSRIFILILSAIVGMASGLTALLLKSSVFRFREFLLYEINHEYKNFFFLVYPAIGILLTLFLRRFIIRDYVKHNIASILQAISKRNSLMRAHKVFSSMLGGMLTAGFGGSIGLESPIISSGAAIGSNLARFFRLDYKKVTLLLACGSSGAISAIFNTPIAGIVFALEVLLIDLSRFSLIPLLLSAVSGAIVTKLFYAEEILFEFSITDAFQNTDILFYILLGVLSAFVSFYFTRTFLWIDKCFESIKLRTLRFLIGSALLGILIFFFPALFGEGFVSMKDIFSGEYLHLIEHSVFKHFEHNFIVVICFFLSLILLKVVALSVTLGAGGIGGIFAPALFTGSFLGFLYAYVLNHYFPDLHVSELNYAMVGMGSVLAGVLHAPLTGIFLIAEITTGYELIVPLMISATISFITIKLLEPDSIITMQLAKRGELITHNKDKAVLRFIHLNELIENDFLPVSIDATLGELVQLISKSKRNIFPVLNKEDELLGIILLDNIREIMFQNELYENTYVRNLMLMPPAILSDQDKMEEVLSKFKSCDAWNLPVISKGKYIGFISKSKMFEVYRKHLLDITED